MTEPSGAAADEDLRWFVEQLVHAVPALAADPRLDVPLGELHIGAIDRTGALRVIEILAGGLPDTLEPRSLSLQELHEVVAVRRDNGAAADSNTAVIERRALASLKAELRPIEAADYPSLYRAACNPEAGYRWRMRGATPGPEQFQRMLFEGTLCQYGVWADARLQGAVFAYNAHFDSGYVFAAYERVAPATAATGASGQMLEAIALLLDHVFRTWSFRKVYFEVPQYNFDRLFSTVGNSGLLAHEGTLSEFVYHDGVHHDLHYLSISRPAWTEFVERWSTLLDLR